MMELQDLFGFAKAVKAVTSALVVSDLKPCNTRFMRVKAQPDAWFRRHKVAFHRMKNGRWEMNAVDAADGASGEADVG